MGQYFSKGIFDFGISIMRQIPLQTFTKIQQVLIITPANGHHPS